MAKIDKSLAAQSITITGISDPLTAATARLAQNAFETAKRDRKVSEPSQHKLTREALEATAAWVERHVQNEATPLDKLKPEQRAFLTTPEARERFEDLGLAIAAAAAKKVGTPDLLAMKIEVINKPSVASCATAISESYGENTTKGVLTIGEIKAAWREMTASDDPSFTPSKSFEAALKNPDFTRKNVEALHVYMTMLLGNLANHGTLEGSGIVCERVFRLPLLPQVTLPDGKPFADQPLDKQHAILADNITAYKTQFARTGYDQIFVQGDDGHLYVGLRDFGSLSKLGPSPTMAFTDPMRPQELGSTRQLGRVLAVVDVNNTKHEATVVFWSRTFAGWGERLNNLFRDVSERPVSAVAALSENLKPDPKAPAAAAAIASGGAGPWFAAVGLAGIAAAIPNTHTLLTVLGVGVAVVGAGATGLSLWSMFRTGKEIGPFLDATGHVVNRAGIRSDEI